jgi:hypothetical protein
MNASTDISTQRHYRTMKCKILTISFLLFVSAALVSAADTPAQEESRYAKMPWHLVDHWWDLGKETPFESLSIDVTISDDVPDTVNLYIAPIGLAHLSKTPFYGGIQTNADGYTKKNPKLRGIGPGFLFSAWGERSHDAIRPADGGFLQSSGHEGDFVSARRPYVWKKGKYTYRLVRMDQETIAGKPHTWVGGFVYSHEKDENVFIGALRFKGEKLMLDGKIANFVEVYGRRRPVADIPKLTVTFAAPIINGVAAKPISAEAIYPKGVPDYADTTEKDGALVVTVGQPVEGRTKRQVRLIGGKR